MSSNYYTQQTGGNSKKNNEIQRGAKALRKIREQIETNIDKLKRIQSVSVNFQDIEQLEAIMLQLAGI